MKKTKKESKLDRVMNEEAHSEDRPKRSSGTSNALLRARTHLTKIIKSEDPFVKMNVDDLTSSFPHISTGSIMIDYLIGGQPNAFGVPPCPGVPRGRITNIYGEEGSGKSTICQMVAAATCREGGTVCYIDWEHAIMSSYAHQLGVPIYDDKKFLLAQPNTLEEGMAIAMSMAREGVDLIVFDSVGAGITKNQAEKDEDEIGGQGPIGLKARIWSDFFPQLQQVISKSGTSVIAISQLRAKIGFSMPGRPPEETVQGGVALKYYSSIRMRFKKIGKIESKVYDPTTGKMELKITGSKVKAKIEKSKVSGSFGKEIEFYIEQGKGIDNILSMIDIAMAHKIILGGGKKSFEWQTPDGEIITSKGLPRFKEKIFKDEKLQQALWSQILPIMSVDQNNDLESDSEQEESE